MNAQEIIPLVLGMAKQAHMERRPSTLPTIVASIMQDRRSRQAIKQQAAESTMRENIAKAQVAAEKEKTEMMRQANMMDALSRIAASGEDIPSELAEMMQAGTPLSLFGGGFNISLPGGFGGKPQYAPPQTSDKDQFFTDVMNAKSADDVRSLIEGKRLSKNQQALVTHRINSFESGRNKEYPTSEEINLAGEGQTEGIRPEVIEEAQTAALRRDTLSGKKDEEAQKRMEERTKFSGLNQQANTALAKGELEDFLTFFSQLSPEEQEKWNKQTVQSARTAVLGQMQSKLEGKNTLADFRNYVTRGVSHGIARNFPENFKRQLYSPLREATAKNELGGYSHNPVRFKTQESLQEFVDKVSDFNDVEGLYGKPQIPKKVRFIQNPHPWLLQNSKRMVVPPQLEFSTETVPAKDVADAKRFWQDVLKEYKEQLVTKKGTVKKK